MNARRFTRGRYLVAAVVVAVAGTLVSIEAFRLTRANEDAQAHMRFDQQVHEVGEVVGERLQDYRRLLASLASLVAVDGSMTRAQWHDFVGGLNLEQSYPGIQGVDFAPRLTAADIPGFERSMRAQGFTDFHVWPAGTRGEYVPVAYREPLRDARMHVLGFDMATESVRRQAMEQARDSGQPALSGRVALVQQDSSTDRQAGTLLYLAVYRPGMPAATVEQRRAALLGFVFTPFRMGDLMSALTADAAHGLRLELYDGSADPEHLLYASAPADRAAPWASSDVALDVDGRQWLLHLSAPAGFAAASAGWAPWVLGAGLLVSLLLAAVLAAFGSSEQRARILAQEMTAALRKAEGQQQAIVSERERSRNALEASEQRYRTVVNALQEGLLLIDGDGAVIACNPAAEHILGVSQEQMRRMWEDDPAWRLLREDGAECSFHGSPVRRTLGTGEPLADQVLGMRTPDGSLHWLSMNTALIPDSGGHGRGVVASFSDITERKQAEQELAAANRLREAILENAPFAIISTDAAGVIRSMNSAAERMLRYHREELLGKVRWEALHAPEEMAARAAELTEETGHAVEPGFEAFVHKARDGVTEEREWTYVRRDGSRIPVHLAVSALRDAAGGISGFFGISYDITERKRREEYTRHIAHHDHLTGLPNRVLLHDRLQMATERSRREGTHVGVLMIDLDQFKRINDSLGHHVGDELLWTVADRLRGCVRAGDTVARMGGDEFVVLLPDIKTPESIKRVAQGIVERVSAPAVVGAHELHVTPSVGVSVFPGDGDDVYALLKHADMAMYQAKAAGRRCYRVFSRAMERAAAERLELEGALRRALQREEFVLHYQPQVCLNTGKVLGVEALLRWNSPVHGPVSPHSFVPVAEETGLIVPLGDWVLRTACQAAKHLEGRNGAPLRLAVNLSPRQFRQGNLETMVEQALIDSGLDPAQLELEITEGVLMDHTEETVERLQRLRRLGVSVAVDDFGTGYSSLSYIARFPIDTLKIDRSFVSKLPDSPGDAAVAQAIVALAHSLNIKVVAEGVENEQQCAFLRARRCDAGQGFHFGKGVPLEEFTAQSFRFAPVLASEKLAEPFDQVAEAVKRLAG